jgi:uncharacterized protein YeaO (DUF488 family)
MDHLAYIFSMTLRIKRVYEPASKADGKRFLVDRLWPRGIKKESLQIEGWLKELAPSNGLRKWFAHDAKKWSEFERRYAEELNAQPEAWLPLRQATRKGKVTLLYSARNPEQNNAIALKKYLERSKAKKPMT